MAEIEKKESKELVLPDAFATMSDEKLVESLHRLSMNKTVIKYLIGCHLLVMKNRGNWSNPETLKKFSKNNCYYPNLDSFCYNEFGITARSGYVYRQFASRVKELGVSTDVLKRALEVGFMRASKIFDAANCVDDIEYFLAKARVWTEREFVLETQVAKQRRLKHLSTGKSRYNTDDPVAVLQRPDADIVESEEPLPDDGLHPVDAPKAVIMQKPVSLSVKFVFEDQLIHYQKAAQILEQKESRVLTDEQVISKLSAFYLAHSVHDPSVAAQVLTTEQLLSAVERATGLKLAVIKDEVD